MRTVFADAGYWIALQHSDDALHETALDLIAALAPLKVVTSELVLTEYLNEIAGRGPHLRRTGAHWIAELHKRRDVHIEPMSRLLFQAALEIYRDRADKSWGLIDCSSFFIMRSLGLTEALSHDRHFEQAGYVALLRSRR